MRAFAVLSRSEEETRILGSALASVVAPGDVISLSGDLGAGKTVLVQGLARALGVEARVTSPTFTLIHEYRGRFPILHLDVYRLDSFQEVLDLGFDELVSPNSVLVVEWGGAVAPLLPRRYLDVEIRQGVPTEPTDERTLIFRPTGPEWAGKLESMRVMAESLLGAVSPDETIAERFRAVPVAPAREHRDLRADQGEI